MLISTEGLILREQNIGESDRLVTVLTRKEGLLRAFVRGARNIKNKNCTATQLLCYSRLNFYKGREKYIIDDSEPVEVFFELRKDIERMALAQYFCELALALAPEEGEAGDFLRLMLNSLYYLAHGKRPTKQIKAVTEMRMLSMAGYMPDLVGCRECGAYEAPEMFFLAKGGGILCPECRQLAKAESGFPVRPSVLTALRYIIYTPFEKIFAFHLSENSLDKLCYACERYLLCQLERDFKTLDFYRQLCPPGERKEN